MYHLPHPTHSSMLQNYLRSWVLLERQKKGVSQNQKPPANGCLLSELTVETNPSVRKTHPNSQHVGRTENRLGAPVGPSGALRVASQIVPRNVVTGRCERSRLRDPLACAEMAMPFLSCSLWGQKHGLVSFCSASYTPTKRGSPKTRHLKTSSALKKLNAPARARKRIRSPGPDLGLGPRAQLQPVRFRKRGLVPAVCFAVRLQKVENLCPVLDSLETNQGNICPEVMAFL